MIVLPLPAFSKGPWERGDQGNGVKKHQVTLLADIIHVLVVSCPHIAGIQRVPHGNYKTAAIIGRADLCFRATPEKREAKVDRERRKFGEKKEEVF